MSEGGRGPVTFTELTAGLIWPRLLRGFALAGHPARLGLALGMIVVVMAPGVLIDWARGPVVPPGGFDAPAMTEQARRTAIGETLDRAWIDDDAASQALDGEEAPDPAAARRVIDESLGEALAEVDEPRREQQLRAEAVEAIACIDEVTSRGVFQTTVATATDSFNTFVVGLLTLDFASCGRALRAVFVTTPRALAVEYPLAGVPILIIFLAVFTLGGGALCRMVACDMSGELRLSATEGLGFALPRWGRSAAAVLIPAAIILAIALGLALGGLVLLRLPGLNLIGGLVYGLMLAAGALLVFLLAGFAVSGAMLIPAVAVESTDSIDANQRAYAYVLGSPGRLAIYAIVLIVEGALAYAVIGWLTAAALNVSADLAGAWAGWGAPLHGGIEPFVFTLPDHGLGLSGTRRGAAALIGLWERLGLAALAAYVVSFFFTASTALYLLLRRVNDGQDIEEIWTDEMIESTMAPTEPRS